MKQVHRKLMVGLALGALLGAAPWSWAEPPDPSPSGSPSPLPSASATPAAQLKTVAKKGKSGPTPININSDKLDYDEKKKKVRLIGSVKITSDKMTITSPYAEFFTDKKTAEFQGGVKMVGEGTTATGRQMHVFYNEQRVVLTGDVRMVSEKVAGGKAGTPSVLLCQEMEYFWITGLGTAKGRVKIRQGNRRAFSDRAVYHRLQQLVDLYGNVQFERGSKDWMSCDKAKMDLAAQTIVAEGSVAIRSQMDEKSKKDAPSEEETSQAKPTPIEPPLPYQSVEVKAPLKLPGVDL